MITRSPGIQSGSRPSRIADQVEVVSTVTAKTIRAGQKDCPRHSSTEPMPTRAATAGASATA